MKVDWQAKICAALIAFCLASLAFVGVMAFIGENPAGVIVTLLGMGAGAPSEVFVKAVPILFCALAVALPGRLGLVNIGGEGQLVLGAIAATCVAVCLPGSGPIGLLMMVLGAVAAGILWGGLPGWLRSKFQVNETLLSLLLNYVAQLFLLYLIHGPWKDPGSLGWPQSRAFPASLILPEIGESRVHLLSVVALVLCILFAYLGKYTRIGFSGRIIQSNVGTARYLRIKVNIYFVVAFCLAGAIAALGGMGEIAGVQGRLRDGFSLGYGYAGFFVAWLCGHRFLLLPLAAVLFACVVVGADSLQVFKELPFATVYLLQGIIFLAVMATPAITTRLGTHIGGKS